MDLSYAESAWCRFGDGLIYLVLLDMDMDLFESSMLRLVICVTNGRDLVW